MVTRAMYKEGPGVHFEQKEHSSNSNIIQCHSFIYIYNRYTFFLLCYVKSFSLLAIFRPATNEKNMYIKNDSCVISNEVQMGRVENLLPQNGNLCENRNCPPHCDLPLHGTTAIFFKRTVSMPPEIFSLHSCKRLSHVCSAGYHPLQTSVRLILDSPE